MKASGSPVIRFEAQAQRTGGSTIVRLPDEASAQLPSRGQAAVNGVMNGHVFHTVLEPDGRRGHWLKVDKKLRQALAASAGDTVTLEVEPAKDWPERRPCCFDLAACTDPDLSKNGKLTEGTAGGTGR